jgi:hypothetical protein
MLSVLPKNIHHKQGDGEWKVSGIHYGKENRGEKKEHFRRQENSTCIKEE